MRKLRNLLQTLSALQDWQEEVERAYAVAEANAAAYKALVEEPQTEGNSAVVINLAAYRALRASA